MGTAVRASDDGAVRRLTLCRAEQYNTITPALRDELGYELDVAQHDRDVRVILLDAEGPAFCAGYELGRRDDRPGPGSTPESACGTAPPTST